MRFLLFILNPFISGIYSLVNINKKNALKILYLWFVIFGIGFIARNEGFDSYRYVEEFYEQSHSLNWKNYVAEIRYYFTYEYNTKDIYTLTVNFIVSRFTDNYHWMFFIYAIIFGYFYTNSLKYLLPYYSKNTFFYILLLLFCFSNPIFNINGVRFWTAAWIGVYALFKIFLDNKYWYYGLLMLTPLIHGAFVIWILVVFIAQFVPKVKQILIVLYVLSISVSISSSIYELSYNFNFMPAYIENMIWNYTQSDYIAEREAIVLPFYARILNELPEIMMTILTFVIISRLKELKKDENFSRLFGVYLVVATIANFLTAIPSTGVRFQKMAIPILAFIWATHLDKLKKVNWVLYLVPLAFSYKILYWIRHMLSVTDWGLYFFPAPITIIKYLFL